MRALLLALLAAGAAAARPERAWPWHAKVDIALYAEALCPYCAGFLAQHAEALAHDYAPIARLRLVPWGNARAAPGGAVVCQHGEAECVLNRIFSCLIDAEPVNWLPVVACASAKYPNVDAAFDKCARRAGANATAARACAASPRGAALQAAAAAETAALVPAHTGVPWLTVDGLALGSSIDAAGVVACAAWRGARPAVCQRAPAGAAVTAA